MSELLGSYLIFLAKGVTLVIMLCGLIAGIIAAANLNKSPKTRGKLVVTKLNEHYQAMAELINQETLGQKTPPSSPPTQSRKFSWRMNRTRNSVEAKPRIFVLDFIGDLKASTVENLREEVTALLTVATLQDEVVIRIESPGGTIHGYGLVASQLRRIRDRGIPLTAAVDKVAASGGYLAACVADRILAAPFAILGSIGVIAQLPNFHRWLKKHDVDFEQVVAGQYKRTLSLFGKNTHENRDKLQEEVNEAHRLFQTFITANRPVVDINRLATGETWYGTQALELRLVDELITSDDYLWQASQRANLFQINYLIKKKLSDRLLTLAHNSLSVFR